MIVYTIRPSKLEHMVMGLICMLATVALFLSDLTGLSRAVLFFGVCAMALDHLPFGLRNPSSLRIRCDDGGSLQIESDDGWVDVDILVGSMVLPGFMVVPIKGRALRIPSAIRIWPDSMRMDDARRLRVWLRCQARIARTGG